MPDRMENNAFLLPKHDLISSRSLNMKIRITINIASVSNIDTNLHTNLNSIGFELCIFLRE